MSKGISLCSDLGDTLLIFMEWLCIGNTHQGSGFRVQGRIPLLKDLVKPYETFATKHWKSLLLCLLGFSMLQDSSLRGVGFTAPPQTVANSCGEVAEEYRGYHPKP